MYLSDYNPLVSVVIPVYRGADFVGQAIESVLAQTYTNIEIIVVDDGSPDGGATRRAVEPYLSRVRYIYQENGGVASALNTGARNMRGEVFSWLSHDDLFVPDKTERQVEFIRQLGRADAVIYSDYMIVDPNNVRMYDVVLDNEMLTRQPLLAILRGSTNGCTMLLPREVFEQVGYFDEALRFTQDYDFWDRIEDHFPLVHCPGIMVRQRVHPGQDSRRPESIIECNALWLRLADNRDDMKKSLISGSPLKFLRDLNAFLSQTPYDGAIRGVEERIASAISGTLVSVILDVAPEHPNLQRALSTLVNQTHSNIELVVVNRSTEPTVLLADHLRQRFTRVEQLDCRGLSAAEARNRAVRLARGGYLAFADSSDMFTPSRIANQLAAMQEAGTLVSCTSFFASCPERLTGYALVTAGSSKLSSPAAVAGCPAWLQTAMFNRLVFVHGAAFAGDNADDTIYFMIEMAKRYSIHCIDDAGVMVELRLDQPPLSLAAAVSSIGRLRVTLDCDPDIEPTSLERQALERRYMTLIEEMRRLRRAGTSEPVLSEALFDLIFVSPKIETKLDLHGVL